MRGKNFFLLTAGMAVFAFLAGRALTAGNCAVRTGAPVNADGRPEIALTFDDGPDAVSYTHLRLVRRHTSQIGLLSQAYLCYDSTIKRKN